VLFGPHDHNLYVSSGMFGGVGEPKGVLRFDGTSGAFLDHFAGEARLTGPRGIIFGPDGNLYVADGNNAAGNKDILDALRSREDFKKLLAELEAKK
jgi:hypothetical protein